MTTRAIALMLIVASTLFAAAARAAGTPAVTTITNSANATYRVNGTPAPPVAASVTITVDELISVRVTPPPAPTGVV